MSPNGQRTHSLDKYAFFRLDNVSSSTLTWLLTLALEDLLVEVNRPAHKISGPSQEYRRCWFDLFSAVIWVENLFYLLGTCSSDTQLTSLKAAWCFAFLNRHLSCWHDKKLRGNSHAI